MSLALALCSKCRRKNGAGFNFSTCGAYVGIPHMIQTFSLAGNEDLTFDCYPVDA